MAENNILVIGNGFDLAHGLKTSYNDFLDFVKSWDKEKFDVPDDIKNEFERIVNNNGFIKHFIDYSEELNTWVDFENEIKKVTYSVYDLFENSILIESSRAQVNTEKVTPFQMKILAYFELIGKPGTGTRMNYRPIEPHYCDKVYGIKWNNIKIKLRNELDDLKKSLIIYLKCFMPIVCDNQEQVLQQLKQIDFDFVCTFNYTDTYRRYGIEQNEDKVLHLHGDLESEKIVLGFNDDNPSDLKLIQFKKYFQQIQYQIRRTNKSILDSLDKHKTGELSFSTHFFGLSLDKTDEDSIKQIFALSNKIIIYYRIKEDGDTSDYEQKVINLIDILGKENFLSALDEQRIVFKVIDETLVERG